MYETIPPETPEMDGKTYMAVSYPHFPVFYPDPIIHSHLCLAISNLHEFFMYWKAPEMDTHINHGIDGSGGLIFQCLRPYPRKHPKWMEAVTSTKFVPSFTHSSAYLSNHPHLRHATSNLLEFFMYWKIPVMGTHINHASGSPRSLIFQCLEAYTHKHPKWMEALTSPK